MEAARWLRGAAAQEELEAVGVLEAAEGALEVFGWVAAVVALVERRVGSIVTD
jgi:hypothetical protein